MSEKIQLNVDGMSCGHCVKAVENGLNDLNGVSTASVTLADGLVEVTYDSSIVSLDAIKEVITEEGYDVK